MVTAWVLSIKPGVKAVAIPVEELKLFLDCVAAMRTDHLAEAEKLRVQLAGCGVAAMCNTEQSRKQQKCVEGDYGWSQSYQDVVNAVGREIKLREERDAIFYKVLGWAHADCCVTLDNGGDPRQTPVPDMIARAKVDLELVVK